MILFKTIIFTLLVPCTVVGLVPCLLLHRWTEPAAISRGAAGYAGMISIAAGVLLYLASAWTFVVRGKGTPAPLDPPVLLVTSGPYRVVRNPMYVGGALILLGEAIIFRSAVLFLYLLCVLLAFHLFVVLYEEPHLEKIFGAAYREYRKTVPRWIPRLSYFFGKKPG